MAAPGVFFDVLGVKMARYPLFLSHLSVCHTNDSSLVLLSCGNTKCAWLAGLRKTSTDSSHVPCLKRRSLFSVLNGARDALSPRGAPSVHAAAGGGVHAAV